MAYRPKIYLVGGMEHAESLGAGWRNEVAPKLVEMGYETLDPCLFEPQQLTGLHTKRLPETIETAQGETIVPTHWHQLKYAPEGSAAHNRFKKYMQRIIQYDINVVKNKADALVCYWTKGAQKGAGTHHEIGTAYLCGKPVYTVIEKGVDYPGWLVGCTTQMFTSFEDLFKVLEDEA